MAKYIAKAGEWISPVETTGSIQNLSSMPIEISVLNENNTGIKLESGQMVNFEGTVYVRSAGNESATFTTVPFKVVAGGGDGSGGGGIPYTLPTMSAAIKGGAKVGNGLKMVGEKLNVDIQAVPTARVDATSTGATITLVDINGTTTANIINGRDGINGKDGYSPSIDVSNISDGHKVEIIDKSGKTSFNIKDGKKGEDGISPSANVSKNGNTATIVIQDKNGTTVANIKDGADGEKGDKGDNGTSFTIKAQYPSAEALIAAHPTGQIGDAYLVLDEQDVDAPNVYMWLQDITTGVYEWQNIGKIRGIKGDKGEKGETGNAGFSPKITVVDNPNGTHTITIETELETTTTVIENGEDGISPIVSLTKDVGASYSTLSIIDKDGTKTVIINDGEDGKSPTISIDESVVGQHKIIFTDPDGTKHITVIKDGKDGSGSSANISHWTPDTEYDIGQLVIYDNCFYECSVAHTSEQTFDALKWVIIGGVSQLKLYDWAAETDYDLNEIVYYGQSIYRCIQSHESQSSFSLDADKWQQIYSDLKSWQQEVYYPVGTIIIQDNKLYRCKIAHTSNSSFSDVNWELLSGGGGGSSSVTLLKDWAINTKYIVNELVYYAYGIYRCKVEHTSSSNFDNSKFELIMTQQIIVPWTINTEYLINTLVIYEGTIYRCILEHISSNNFTNDMNKWQSLSAIRTWSANTNYFIGEIIRYGGTYYYVLSAFRSSNNFDDSNLEPIKIGLNWKQNYRYEVGAVVIFNDKWYRCIIAHMSGQTFDDTKFTIVGGSSSLPEWETETNYSENELVVYNGNMYRCIIAHISDANSFDNDIENWEVIYSVKSWSENTNYFKGELVRHEGTYYYVTNTFKSSSTFSEINLDPIKVGFNWKPNRYYDIGALIVINDRWCRCNTAHTSSSSFDSTKWTVIGSGTIATKTQIDDLSI